MASRPDGAGAATGCDGGQPNQQPPTQLLPTHTPTSSHLHTRTNRHMSRRAANKALQPAPTHHVDRCDRARRPNLPIILLFAGVTTMRHVLRGQMLQRADRPRPRAHDIGTTAIIARHSGPSCPSHAKQSVNAPTADTHGLTRACARRAPRPMLRVGIADAPTEPRCNVATQNTHGCAETQRGRERAHYAMHNARNQ